MFTVGDSNSPADLISMTFRYSDSNYSKQELNQIIDMIQPLEIMSVTGSAEYACRHWNRITGRCQIYDHRPFMCRNYPYNRGDACVHCGLTLKELQH
jgi:Fe-S-cluster containining protein